MRKEEYPRMRKEEGRWKEGQEKERQRGREREGERERERATFPARLNAQCDYRD